MNKLNLFSPHDLLAFAGCVCAGLGLWQIHPPTALIVIGLCVATVGVLLGRPRK